MNDTPYSYTIRIYKHTIRKSASDIEYKENWPGPNQVSRVLYHATVKHLSFAWPYFREATNLDIFTRLYFSDLSYFVLWSKHNKLLARTLFSRFYALANLRENKVLANKKCFIVLQPKSVCNPCVIQHFGSVFVLSLCCFGFSLGEEDFVIELSQISSLFLLITIHFDHISDLRYGETKSCISGSCHIFLVELEPELGILHLPSGWSK